MRKPVSQRQIVRAVPTARGMARLAELREAGVTAVSAAPPQDNPGWDCQTGWAWSGGHGDLALPCGAERQ